MRMKLQSIARLTLAGALAFGVGAPPVKAGIAAPQGQKKTSPGAKKHPVPANWITMANKVKGYEFRVPQGTTQHTETVKGMDVYLAVTPKPSEIGILVVAFKDKTLTRENLFEIAGGILENFGETDIHVAAVEELSPDYALADATSLDKDNKKSRYRVLVATDKTDNYIMIVGTDEDKFDANHAIIDEIWGSFAMYSGGASGES
jgi:hypothetical protein